MSNPAYFGRLIISGSEVLQEKTYATLPGQASHASGETAASVGEIANISDGSTSNFGAIVVGGGTKHVLVRYDGTNWVVLGGSSTGDGINAAKLYIAGQAIGDLLYADSTTSFTRLADVAAGSVLVSGGIGVAPSWSSSPSVTNLTATGLIKAADGTAANPSNTFTGSTGTGLFRTGSSIRISSGGTDTLAFNYDTNGQVKMIAAGQLAWSSTSGSDGAVDLALFRDAANTLALRNGTSPQELRVYNSTTNTQYGRLTWSSNVFQIDTVQSGGTDRDIRINAPTGQSVKLAINGSDIITVSGTQLAGTGAIVAGTGSEFRFPSSTRLLDVSNGVVRFANSAATGFTRLILGTNDATTSGVSWNLNSGRLEAKTGDGSAYTTIVGSAVAGATSLQVNINGSTGIWTFGTDGSLTAASTYALTTSGLITTATLATTGLLTKYNNVNTAGKGVSAIYGYGDTVAATNTGTASIATYTPTADGTYQVGANCLVTTSTAHSFSLDCTYTDEGNTSRTLVLPVAQLAGTFLTSGLITNVTGAGPYESPQMTIRVKANTAITIRTSSGGTFTTVVYNARGFIKQAG